MPPAHDVTVRPRLPGRLSAATEDNLTSIKLRDLSGCFWDSSHTSHSRRKIRRAHVPAQNEEQAHWFAEELQPHESTLRGWLWRQFPEGCDIDDIVQEAFMRVL